MPVPAGIFAMDKSIANVRKLFHMKTRLHIIYTLHMYALTRTPTHTPPTMGIISQLVSLYLFLFCIVPEEAPSSVAVTVESSRSIVLSWRAPRIIPLHGELVEYHIIVEETQILNLENGTVISQEGINRNRTSDAREDTEVVNMLHPNYNYTIRIAAQTTVGMGPFSEPITVRTIEDGE